MTRTEAQRLVFDRNIPYRHRPGATDALMCHDRDTVDRDPELVDAVIYWAARGVRIPT